MYCIPEKTWLGLLKYFLKIDLQNMLFYSNEKNEDLPFKPPYILS